MNSPNRLRNGFVAGYSLAVALAFVLAMLKAENGCNLAIKMELVSH